MEYAYAKSENMPELALCYGDYLLSWENIHLFLLAKEEDQNGEVKYYAYCISKPYSSEMFKLSYLEKLYYENPDSLRVSNILFSLEKKQVSEHSFFRSSFRYVAEERYMSEFEKTMFNFFKKAYEIKKQTGELDLLSPGEIGVTPEGKMYLYLGKFNKSAFELISLNDYDRSTSLGSVEKEREDNEIRNIVMTIEENCRVKKEYINNMNIYLEINGKHIPSDFYDFDYDISDIQPNELEKMIISVLPSHQRLRIVKKYEGKLNYLVSSAEDPINEIVLYIPGNPYNEFHKTLSVQIFKNQLNRIETDIYENEDSYTSVMKVKSTRFRTIKIYLGDIQ